MFAAVAFALGLLVTMLGSSASGAPVDERLAFARGSSPGQYDIWTIQNGTKHRVTRSCGWDWWPDWSPDGTRIAFGRECRARSFDIYTVGSNGAGLRRLTSGAPVDQWPAWSPNGREIVFVRGVSAGSELYVVNAAGGGLHRLTRNKVMDQAPAWSPDGQSIAFSRTIGGRNRLMLMRADGSGQRSIRSVPGGEPAWSPDGSRLAFARAVRGAARETASIYVLTLGRAGVQKVTFDRPGSVSHHPTWSADGRLIAFMSNRAALGRGASLYAVRPDGKGLHRLTRAVFEDVDPAWLRLAQ
jgi:TolB protein